MWHDDVQAIGRTALKNRNQYFLSLRRAGIESKCRALEPFI